MNKKRCHTLLPLVQLLPTVATAAAVLFALPRTVPVLAAVPEKLTAFCPPLILLAPAGYALFARWVLEKKVFYQYLPDIDDGIDKENKDCSHQD